MIGRRSLPAAPAFVARTDVQAGLVAAAASFVWLLAGPRTPDLAAQSYRVALFQREGFAIWDNGWYAGHHLPAYSLLYPLLAAEFGMRLVGALAAVLAACCFARLVESHFGRGARIGILWFALATSTDLLIGRLTYALGAALGLAALYALHRSRGWAAAVLAALTAAATPLAGIFLAMVGAALFCVGRRRAALILAVPALGVGGAMAVIFPEGGREPFNTLALIASVVLTLAFVCLTRGGLLRIGGVLFLLGTLVSFVLVTPIGGNTTRLGAVVAGPLLLCARAGRPAGGPPRRSVARASGVALVALFAWQWFAPVREVVKGLGDPLSRTSSYTGLLAFLAAHDADEGRVEVPFTRSHWEAAYLSSRVALARGWETQLDEVYNQLFFRKRLPPEVYHAWLSSLGVRYVAVPEAPPDPTSRAEVRLVLGGLPYLHLVYRDRLWRVFALDDPPPMASPPATLTALGGQSFTLAFARPGTSIARIRFTPYWQASSGCVQRAPGGFTEVRVPRAGVVRVAIRFSASRIIGSGGGCRTAR